MKKIDYTPKERKIFSKLKTPAKIQDYLNSLEFNFEKEKETCMSPRRVIESQKAHCMEAAMFAAAAIEFHGSKPLVVDLRVGKRPFDFDHVVALFKEGNFFGAISKTNHAVLRYRDPIYKSVRELVLSYFNEYYLENGKKTLREYSRPFNLNHFKKLSWQTSEEDLFEIPEYLDKIKHYKLLTPKQIKNLRKVDRIEVKAGDLEEYNSKLD